MSKYEEYVAERIKIINDKNKAKNKLKQFKEEIDKIFNELPNEKRFNDAPIDGFLIEYALKKNAISEQELNNYYFNDPNTSSREFIQMRVNESQKMWDLVKNRISNDIFEDVNLDYLAVEMVKSGARTMNGLTVENILFKNHKNNPHGNVYNMASDAFKLPECYCDAEKELEFINKFIENIIKYKKIIGMDFDHQKKLLKNKKNKLGLESTLYEREFYKWNRVNFPDGQIGDYSIREQRELLEQCRKILKGEIESKYTNEEINELCKQLNNNINQGLKELDEIVNAIDKKAQVDVLGELFKYYELYFVYRCMETYNYNHLLDSSLNQKKEKYYYSGENNETNEVIEEILNEMPSEIIENAKPHSR